MRFFRTWVTALPAHITSVVGVRSKKQVFRVGVELFSQRSVNVLRLRRSFRHQKTPWARSTTASKANPLCVETIFLVRRNRESGFAIRFFHGNKTTVVKPSLIPTQSGRRSCGGGICALGL